MIRKMMSIRLEHMCFLMGGKKSIDIKNALPPDMRNTYVEFFRGVKKT